MFSCHPADVNFYWSILEANRANMSRQTDRQTDYITDRLDTSIVQAWIPESNRASKQHHNYLPLYHRHFQDVRLEVRKVLEIGVQTDHSVNMWQDYFPNAEIHGIDIDPECKKFERDRIRIHTGDQGDQKFLATLPQDFDIIIDDGSHIPQHQVGCFLYLFPYHLKDRGIYVVEDCENKPQTIKFFASLPEFLNFWPENVKDSEWASLNSLDEYTEEYFVKNLLGLSFYRYIVFIDKGKNPQDGEAAKRLRQLAGKSL